MSVISLCSNLYAPCSLSPIHVPTPKQRCFEDIVKFRHFNPLSARNPVKHFITKKNKFHGVVCLAGIPPDTLQWVSTISSAVLMLAKSTGINKSFLAPLFALQAPWALVSWIKGEYGTWTAFLALLIRLFYFIPGELELPFWAFLLVLVMPYQSMNLRGTHASAIISLAMAAYMAYQHFARMGDIRKAFHQDSLMATAGIIGITAIPLLLLF